MDSLNGIYWQTTSRPSNRNTMNNLPTSPNTSSSSTPDSSSPPTPTPYDSSPTTSSSSKSPSPALVHNSPPINSTSSLTIDDVTRLINAMEHRLSTKFTTTTNSTETKTPLIKTESSPTSPSDDFQNKLDSLELLVHGQQSTLNALGHQVQSTVPIRQSYVTKYPLLFPHSKSTFNYSKFSDLIKDITLDGDDVCALELFWQSFDTALCTSLSSPFVLTQYKHLDCDYDIQHELLPPRNHPHFQEAMDTYNIFSHALQLHLIKPTTIDSTVAPNANEKLIKYYNDDDGFRILQELIFILSPQLFGPTEDFSTSILLIKIQPNMSLSTLYDKCIRLSKRIELQQDSSGALIRLIH